MKKVLIFGKENCEKCQKAKQSYKDRGYTVYYQDITTMSNDCRKMIYKIKKACETKELELPLIFLSGFEE